MFRKSLFISMSLSFAVSLGAAGGETPSQAKLSAAAIVDKNVAARGGLQAWRAAQTMAMQGKLGAGGKRRATISVPILGTQTRRQALPPRPPGGGPLPVVMALKRASTMRMERQFNER